MNPATPDPEMIKMLELLLNWEEVNEEPEWETLVDLSEVEDEAS
jgi:hypothetical protein